MAALFKIVFAFLALIAIVSAVQAAGTDPKRSRTKGVQAGGNRLVPRPTPVTVPRRKRACKTITYEKGGRTITAQKC